MNRGFDDYQRALSRKGDVEIGLAARRRRWRNILVSCGGVVLILGAWWMYRTLAPKSPGGGSGQYQVKIRCVIPECGYEGVVTVPSGELFPMTCPKCGQESGKQVWRCRDCGHEFVPRPKNTELRCPDCGSENVGTAVDAQAP